ncbi:MAG: diguanylate cyclase [Bacteroidota bacterium]
MSSEKATCLHLLTNVLKSLKSVNQPERVYHLVIDLVERMFKCQACAIVLIDPSTEYLKIETGIGISHLFQKSFRKRISTGAIGNLIWDEKPIIVRDSSAEPELSSQVALEQPFGSCVCMQLSADHRTLGYLYMAMAAPHDFTSEELAVLQACADAAAVALYKCWLAEEILQLERVDRETGLEKYSVFQDRLAATMERAVEFHEPFALMIGDVDNFKSISNTYGYTASKKMLQELSGIVRSSLRPVDGAARFGFDEFIILRSNVNSDEARQFAESLRSTICNAQFTPSGISTTLSIGLAVHPQSGSDPAEMLLTAKKALFEAQRTGRNKVVAPATVDVQSGSKKVSAGGREQSISVKNSGIHTK